MATKTLKQWRVVSQTGRRTGRILFRGLEHDARRFIEERFPRPHVDEFTENPNNPVHDVKLVSPAGVEEVFNSHVHENNGWSPVPQYDEPEEEEFTGEDDDTEEDEN